MTPFTLFFPFFFEFLDFSFALFFFWRLTLQPVLLFLLIRGHRKKGAEKKGARISGMGGISLYQPVKTPVFPFCPLCWPLFLPFLGTFSPFLINLLELMSRKLHYTYSVV